MTFIHF